MKKKDVDFSERYDDQEDIYYVTFKSGEPSYVMEIDDIVLLEIGIFTGMPTGFRILNYSKEHLTNVKNRLRKAQDAVESLQRKATPIFQDRSKKFTSVLQQTFAGSP